MPKGPLAKGYAATTGSTYSIEQHIIGPRSHKDSAESHGPKCLVVGHDFMLKSRG